MTALGTVQVGVDALFCLYYIMQAADYTTWLTAYTFSFILCSFFLVDFMLFPFED